MGDYDRGRSPPRGGGGRDRSRSPDRGGGGGGSGKKRGVAGRWNAERGFGFISPAEGGEDLFCHFSSITDGNALAEGQQVEYDAEIDAQRGKQRAINVTGGVTVDRQAPSRDQPCFDFQKGACTRGDQCRFSHDSGMGGGGGGGEICSASTHFFFPPSPLFLSLPPFLLPLLRPWRYFTMLRACLSRDRCE